MGSEHDHVHAHGAVHGHDHGSAHDDLPGAPAVRRAVLVAVVAWGVVTVLVMVLLWPSAERAPALDTGQRVTADVVGVQIQPCTGTEVAALVECRLVQLRITSGPTVGDEAAIEQAVGSGGTRLPEVGDSLVLSLDVGADGTDVYTFIDYERSGALGVLLVLFCVTVLVFGRWRGLGALAGLAISILVLVVFVLPALQDGASPVLVAIVGASVIAYASLYLAHGVNPATNVALLSTLLALALTGLLAWIFVEAATLTGLSDENALFLEALGVQFDLRGLLLAGIVMGSLGVLDDVTVTQVSTVGALWRRDPGMPAGTLYREALTVGRDHVSSAVNTLFLAYAGASLPLLLLFSQTGRSVGEAITGEDVAIEVVRTLVGSIGLVASVPISTWLAAAVVSRAVGSTPSVSPADDGGAASGAAG